MKKVVNLVMVFFLAVFTSNAASEHTNVDVRSFYNGSSYIFVEGGVEFSVFPDGQFDFVFLGNQGNNVQVNINRPGVNISFNGGYNYDAYVQYDDYGAVIQIENVPIFYDNFGRIIQAGSVEINYLERRIVRVGGMRIFYNNFGYFSHYTGFISPWYTTYIYRPWHVFYARPFFGNCIVYDYPYRLYYSPIRYSYNYHFNNFNRGHQYYTNGRRDFYRPGSRIHYRNGRTAVNRDFNPNRVNTAVSNSRVERTNRIETNNSSINTRVDRNNNLQRGENTVSPSNLNRNNRNDVNTASRTKPSVTSNNNTPRVNNRSTKNNYSRKTIAQNNTRVINSKKQINSNSRSFNTNRNANVSTNNSRKTKTYSKASRSNNKTSTNNTRSSRSGNGRG